MNNINQKVTIGIPTFNRSNLLSQAINSALRQSYQNIEVIVSDNGSTDNTSEIISSCCDTRLLTLSNRENLGMVYNWNSCLNNASGKFFLMLSDDDVLEEFAIESLLSCFVDDSILVSYGAVSFINENGPLINHDTLLAPHIESGKEFISNVLKGKRVAYPSATLFRTLEAKRAGGYPDIGTSTDFALHAILVKDGKISFNAKPVVQYRVHKESESFSQNALESQLKLVNWIGKKECPLGEFKEQINVYSSKSVYELGRYYALRGQKDNLNLTLSILRKISSNIGLRILLFFFNSRFIQIMNHARKRVQAAFNDLIK